MSTTLPLFDEPETTELESTTELRIADEAIIARRSELENYGNCPLSARLQGSVGKLAVAGEQGHKIIASAVRAHIESHGSLSVQDLADQMNRGSSRARGDVNQEAIDGIRPSVWSIARYIKDIPWQNMLAFDGGDGSDGGEDLKASYIYEDEDGGAHSAEVTCSGQFDADIDVLVDPKTREMQEVRLTAEFDLLHAVRYPNRLQLVDWKTGHAKWTDSMVEASFQFQFYAYLTLVTFPTMEAVDVVIFNTRHNTRTAGVRFTRNDTDRIRGRIEEACRTFLLNRLLPIEQVEARPSREGCQFCDVAARCTVADRDISDIAADPGAAVDVLIALEQKQKSIETTLKAICKKSGQDIVSPSGARYGFNKPKTRALASLYTVTATTEGDD